MDDVIVMKNHLVPTFGMELPRTFTITHPDGREAVIDFGGDAVVYSGDLPVDESAKIFFDAVFLHFK